MHQLSVVFLFTDIWGEIQQINQFKKQKNYIEGKKQVEVPSGQKWVYELYEWVQVTIAGVHS